MSSDGYIGRHRQLNDYGKPQDKALLYAPADRCRRPTERLTENEVMVILRQLLVAGPDDLESISADYGGRASAYAPKAWTRMER